MVLEIEQDAQAKGWPELMRCDTCPWEAEGRTFTWLEKVASAHTRANSGHRVYWAAQA